MAFGLKYFLQTGDIMTNIKIWYLYNSGFAIKLNNKLLIFDYYLDDASALSRGLDSGVIRKDDLEGLSVYVFVSHNHYDHFNRVIFSWEQWGNAAEIHYILSSDIDAPKLPSVTILEPNAQKIIGEVFITSLKSNDEGIAFFLEVDNIHIFHSGDLNWWNWSDETDEWKKNIESTYKLELSKLKPHPIDIAFIPVDPRLDKNYALSLQYFSREIAPPNCLIFPMHFRDKLEVFEQLEKEGYLENKSILPINSRGQLFEIIL